MKKDKEENSKLIGIEKDKKVIGDKILISENRVNFNC
jgi:hypothetical protein